MARYQPTVDIWAMDDEARAKLQPGQWVSAGSADPMHRGIWMGMTKGKTCVVAWRGNTPKRGPKRRQYLTALRDYARGR